jgi:preprotein translocase subunit SecY
VLGEAVPLCCADPTALPHGTLQLLNLTSLASHGSLQLLHPFLIGIVPFVEAMIFCQIIGTLCGWNKLPVPARFKLSRTQTQTPYGRAAIMFMSACMGACLATGFALVATKHLISCTAVGHAQLWDITAALVAGSAIMYKLSDLITEFGLGQGISFIYMVCITSSAQSTALSMYAH